MLEAAKTLAFQTSCPWVRNSGVRNPTGKVQCHELHRPVSPKNTRSQGCPSTASQVHTKAPMASRELVSFSQFRTGEPPTTLLKKEQQHQNNPTKPTTAHNNKSTDDFCRPLTAVKFQQTSAGFCSCLHNKAFSLVNYESSFETSSTLHLLCFTNFRGGLLFV